MLLQVEKLVCAQGQPVLAFNCLARGDKFGSGPLPGQQVQCDVPARSQQAVGHSCFTARVQPGPAGSLLSSTKERARPSISLSRS